MNKMIVRIAVMVLVLSMASISSLAAYSPSNAITYSNTYAENPNYLNSSGNGYSYFNDHDCTNFVSQCLYAGGLSQDSTWYSYVQWHANAPSRVNSTAWVNANTFKNYLKNSGRATKIGSWSKSGTPAPYLTYAYVDNSSNLTNTNKGKVVIFYDWEGDGTMNHAALFVKNYAASTFQGEGYADLINQHSDNRKQVSWVPDKRGSGTHLYTQRLYAFQLN